MTLEALTFDVFGTVVDWRGSIIREGEALAKRHALDVDWPAFADAWRAGYAPAMQRVREGTLPWTRIDDLHRMILDELLDRFDIELDEAGIVDLNLAWHRLDPWPDAVEGLTRLRPSYKLATLSNGNVSLLVDMAKRADLPWDCILSAELIRHYKPDPETYLGAADLLGCQPSGVMMVAAHPGDLRAAAAVGLRTALVTRLEEFGPERGLYYDLDEQTDFDLVASDFLDLADQLAPGERT